MENRFREFEKKIDSIVVFKGVKEGRVLVAFKALLSALPVERVKKYAEFETELFKYNYNFSEYLSDAVATDENEYVKLISKGLPIPKILDDCVKGELGIFGELASITFEDIECFIHYDGYLPKFETTRGLDFESVYRSRIKDICRTGYGMYAHNTMFRLVNHEIVPVKSPDKTTVDRLFGYERERGLLIDNTKALLEGRPAANTLLVGDAGTGKSSSVKAVVNMFASSGLRLVEIRKEQIEELPLIMEELRDNPLKFIIFIDDLSFGREDKNLGSLKAILEGSASATTDNTVIYATSNRRHLIHESFSDREGDEIHRQDTIQEQISLSDRFGLSILFVRPQKPLYIEIVLKLAKAKGIEMDEKELADKACIFALRKGGFSPRAAEQFTDSLL